MAGAGKTACALELAYRHQEAFAAAAFWQAPTKDDEWASALADFANRLDIQLGEYGFTMAGHITTVAALESFLPRLRSLLARTGVLLVLDNLETLLTEEGAWRDPRWAPLLSALASHDGESRRDPHEPRRPRRARRTRASPGTAGPFAPAGASGAGAAGSRVLPLPVHALSRDESAVLARELPNLRALLHADSGPVRADPAAATAQDLETAEDLEIAEVAEAGRRRVAADRDRVRARAPGCPGPPQAA